MYNKASKRATHTEREREGEWGEGGGRLSLNRKFRHSLNVMGELDMYLRFDRLI